jgi:hypothetical protein
MTGHGCVFPNHIYSAFAVVFAFHLVLLISEGNMVSFHNLGFDSWLSYNCKGIELALRA